MPREWILWRLIWDENTEKGEWMPQVNVYAFECFNAKKFLETHVRNLDLHEDIYLILPSSKRPKATKNCTVKELK